MPLSPAALYQQRLWRRLVNNFICQLNAAAATHGLQLVNLYDPQAEDDEAEINLKRDGLAEIIEHLYQVEQAQLVYRHPQTDHYYTFCILIDGPSTQYWIYDGSYPRLQTECVETWDAIADHCHLHPLLLTPTTDP